MFFNLMFVSFHGIMEVLVIGIGGYIIISGLRPGTNYMDFLTRLLIRFTLPALVFSNLARKFNPAETEYWWAFPLLAVGGNIAGALFVWAYVSVDRSVKNRGEFMALVALQNAIFLPLAMAPVLFGPDRLPTFLNLIFLYNFLSVPTFFTLGVWLVSAHTRFIDRIKGIVNPPNAATILGLVFALTGWGASLPEWIIRPMATFGSLSAPLSTLLVGGIIVTNLPKARAGDWREPVKAAALKCLIFPILNCILVYFTHPPAWIALFIIMESVMPSAMLIALVARPDEDKQRLVAAGILLTSLVSIVTIPLFMGVYGALY
ncbi:MAG: AEC family transporter [Candidatus Latescibacter sp.]|nr:AEC family transporter [Candidatus Latescibacter sp.]